MSASSHRLLKQFNPQSRDLNILRNYENPSVNVVAVHGLAADPIGTWVEKKDVENIIPEARIWTFGYYSSWCGDKSVDTRLSEVATKLLDDIYQKSLVNARLIFVAHSFGGIVVLKALLESENLDNEWSKHEAFNLFRYTDAVLFFGTPFRGTHEWFQEDLPRLASEIDFHHVDKAVFETFRRGSEILAQLRNRFIEKQHRYKRPNIGCFQELQLSNVGKIVGDEKIPKIILVQRDDATLEGPSTGEPRILTRTLERNHFNMHNFGKDDRVFQTVERVLKDIVPFYCLQSLCLNTPLAPDDQECLKSLSFSEMDDRFHDIEEASFDTCAWLLEHETYCAWLSQRPDHLSIEGKPGEMLCIKGKPGAGKSTLMKYAVMKHRSQNCVLAKFFFHARGTELQRTSSGLYRSLLHQLLFQILSLRPDVRKIYQAKNQTHNEWSWHVNELKKLLIDAIKNAAKHTLVVIYIDALDECDLEQQAKLTCYFEELKAKTSVQICFSCRHYPHMIMNSCLEICVEKENNKDIIQYTEMTFQAKSWIIVEGPDIQVIKEIREDIITRSSQLFQWVYLVIQIIEKLKRNCLTWKIVQRRIREIPKDLNELYTYILSRLDEEHRFKTPILLRWVCFARRPLTPNELRIAMTFDTDIPYQSLESWRESEEYYRMDAQFESLITSLSGGLAEVAGTPKRPIVQFIHESVNTYLQKEGIAMLSMDQPGSIIGQCHDRLTRACLFYIKRQDFRRSRDDESLVSEVGWYNGYRFASLGSEFEEPAESETEESIESEDTRFVGYAVRSWSWHSQNAEKENCSQDKLLTWFEFPSLTIVRNLIYEYSKVRPEPPPITGGSTLLHIASYFGLLSLIQALLARNDVNIHLTDHRGCTALYIACVACEGGVEAAKLLLNVGADINAQGGFLGNPLQAACSEGQEELVKLLLREKADVNAQGGHYGNALQGACASEQRKTLIPLLLREGANVNAQGGEYGTALCAAVIMKDEALIILLLREGADINAQSGKPYGTALCAAVVMKNEALIILLLREGADINAQSGEIHGTALCAAVTMKDEALIMLLLREGADINTQGGELYGTALCNAIAMKNEALIILLLREGADINAQGVGLYGTALCLASAMKDETLVTLLLREGADVNANGLFGTALDQACFGKNKEMIRLLLNAGAEDSTGLGKAILCDENEVTKEEEEIEVVEEKEKNELQVICDT